MSSHEKRKHRVQNGTSGEDGLKAAKTAVGTGPGSQLRLEHLRSVSPIPLRESSEVSAHQAWSLIERKRMKPIHTSWSSDSWDYKKSIGFIEDEFDGW